jgi:hypothetical protein
MKAEISFDLVMHDNMPFVEGTYRLPGCEWQVLIVTPYPISKPSINIKAKWRNGITGCAIHFPDTENLNKATVMQLCQGLWV